MGVLLYLLGRLTAKKQVTITSTALAEADEAKVVIDNKADEARALADKKEVSALTGIESARSAEAAAVTQSQIAAAQGAQGDSEKVNALLHQVGKDMRR